MVPIPRRPPHELPDIFVSPDALGFILLLSSPSSALCQNHFFLSAQAIWKATGKSSNSLPFLPFSLCLDRAFDVRAKEGERREEGTSQFRSSIRVGCYRTSEMSSDANDDVRNKALASIAEVKEVVSKKEKEYRKLLKKVGVMCESDVLEGEASSPSVLQPVEVPCSEGRPPLVDSHEVQYVRARVRRAE